MSTRSLDLSSSLRNHNVSNEFIRTQHARDLRPKIDANKLQCYEEMGARLIEDRLLLSALELYAELAEAGHEILCLKQFFSNPGNFEKSAKKEFSQLMGMILFQSIRVFR